MNQEIWDKLYEFALDCISYGHGDVFDGPDPGDVFDEPDPERTDRWIASNIKALAEDIDSLVVVKKVKLEMNQDVKDMIIRFYTGYECGISPGPDCGPECRHYRDWCRCLRAEEFTTLLLQELASLGVVLKEDK